MPFCRLEYDGLRSWTNDKCDLRYLNKNKMAKEETVTGQI